MATSIKYRAGLILICLAFLLTSQQASAQVTIARSFEKLTLGMSIADLKAAYKAKEVASSSLLAGEQLFGVDDQINGIDRVWCTFYLGKLFRIEYSHSPQFSRLVPWDRFLEPTKKLYGEGSRFETTEGELVVWNDGKTTHMLERRAVSRSTHIYEVSLADDDLYNARQESCPAQKFKV